MRIGHGTVDLGTGRDGVRRPAARSAARWAGIVTVALVLVATGCRRPMPEGDAGDAGSEMPGCWQLEVVSDGAPGDSTPSELSGASLPILRLDTVRVEVGAESREQAPTFEAGSYDGTRLERQPFSAWRRLVADSLLVYRPGALAGYTLRLAPQDNGFSGVLVSFTDAMEPGRPSRRTVPVRATPTSCPSGGSTAKSSPGP